MVKLNKEYLKALVLLFYIIFFVFLVKYVYGYNASDICVRLNVSDCDVFWADINKTPTNTTILMNRTINNTFNNISIVRDFINCNGKKLVIEFDGFYTHTKDKSKKKEEHYLKYGFKTLSLDYSDIKDFDLLREKINNFVGGEYGNL